MSTAVAEKLTAMERSDLVHLESTIEHGLQTFVEVGEALAKIRDAKLYKEEHPTFESYLSDRWDLSGARARQLIAASSTTVGISTVDPEMAPANEGQAKALGGLPADEAADVMRRAHEATDGKVTAKAIKEARHPPPTPEPTDVVDAEIVDDPPEYVNTETGEVTDQPPPERQRPGATRWSTTIQGVSHELMTEMENLTDDELHELKGAVEFLHNYIKGERAHRDRSNR